MLKIEFDPSNTAIALAIGKALLEIGGGAAPANTITSAVELVSEADAERAFSRDVLEQNNEGDVIGDNAGMGNGAGAITAAADAGAPTGEKPTHDEKGVIFIPAICANAAKPLYASGPYKGQWKKGTKVEQAEYDRVYAAALAALGSTQTQVGQTVADSPAAQVFQQQTPMEEVIQEHPATPAEAFDVYTYLLQNGGAGAANEICTAAGIANGTLIFSRPDLAPRLYSELSAQKAALVGNGG